MQSIEIRSQAKAIDFTASLKEAIPPPYINGVDKHKLPNDSNKLKSGPKHRLDRSID